MTIRVRLDLQGTMEESFERFLERAMEVELKDGAEVQVIASTAVA